MIGGGILGSLVQVLNVAFVMKLFKKPVAKPELLYDDESGEARNIESIEAGVRNPMSFTGNGNYRPADRPNTGLPPGAFDT